MCLSECKWRESKLARGACVRLCMCMRACVIAASFLPPRCHPIPTHTLLRWMIMAQVKLNLGDIIIPEVD